MTKRSRRTHAPPRKEKVTLAAIKGEKTLVELAQQFDVRANQITTLKEQLLEGASGVFGPEKADSKEAAVDSTSLRAKIGEWTLENDFWTGALTKAGPRPLYRPADESARRRPQHGLRQAPAGFARGLQLMRSLDELQSPDAARLCLSRCGRRPSEPARPVALRVHHDGGGVCVEAFEEALAKHGKPEIFNTDQQPVRQSRLRPRAARCEDRHRHGRQGRLDATGLTISYP